MSQPFADVVVTGTGARECVSSGYPRIRAWGHRGFPDGPARVHRVGIAIHHGIYERGEPAPRPVLLSRRHRAVFSVGTTTAYQGGRRPITITRLRITLPGDHSAVTLPVVLLATRPAGHPVPVGLTALQALGGRKGPAHRALRSR